MSEAYREAPAPAVSPGRCSDDDVSRASASSARSAAATITSRSDNERKSHDKSTSPAKSVTSNSKAANINNRLPPVVTTPARDPSALVTKRMQRLQFHSTAAVMSPSPSNLLMAESPMRTFGGPGSNTPPTRHHYDLTPVMRNTSAFVVGNNSNSSNNQNNNMADSAAADMGDLLDFDLDLLDANPRGKNVVNLISPDGGEGFLHGEHLAFPEDLCKGPTFSARNMHPSPVLPPLASRGLFPLAKKNGPAEWGLGSTENQQAPQNLAATMEFSSNYENVCASNNSENFTPSFAQQPVIRAPELAFFPPMEDPVPFPPSGKNCYSFTSMKQYQKQRHPLHESSLPFAAEIGGGHLKPYQPSRPDVGVGHIPLEELDQIFAKRGQRSNEGSTGTRTGTATPTAARTASTSTDQDEYDDDYDADNLPQMMQQQLHQGGEATQRQLFPAIPIEDRQWSIPSLRLANQLNGGSVASFTTYTDEDEESLLMMYRDDDASLSSLGSYTQYYAGGEDIPLQPNNFVVSISNQQQPCFSSERTQDMAFEEGGQSQQQNPPQTFLEPPALQEVEKENGEENDKDTEVHLPTSTSSKCHRRRRRQKRKEQRERNAYEWLRTVKAGAGDVAEAASSKFLMGQIYHADDDDQGDLVLSMRKNRPQKRLSVAVGIEARAFAVLKDPDNYKHCVTNKGDNDDSEGEVNDGYDHDIMESGAFFNKLVSSNKQQEGSSEVVGKQIPTPPAI